MKEIKIKINSITIKDENTGEEVTVETVRNIKEVVDLIGETEGERYQDEAVSQRYDN